MFVSTALALGGFMLSSAAATMKFGKRDSWGAAFSLGPSTAGIISTQTTVYPGAPPSTQEGYLFAWLGISNGTGDLIQSIIGSYPLGESECSDYTLETWCISSEVYGNTDAGTPNQWVGTLTTADADYSNGIILNYTLVDASTYLWVQTMTDAVTGTLLSTFNKTSGPMLGWGTANECNDNNGVACTGTVSEQLWYNSTIILESADSSFSDTLGAGTGVTYTDMTTADGGITWTIDKITIPAMTTDSSSNSTDTSSASSSSAVAGSVTSSSAVAGSVASSSAAVGSVATSSVASGFVTSTTVAAVSSAAAVTSAADVSASAPAATSYEYVPTSTGGAASETAPAGGDGWWGFGGRGGSWGF